jgi:hypothetical protein
MKKQKLGSNLRHAVLSISIFFILNPQTTKAQGVCSELFGTRLTVGQITKGQTAYGENLYYVAGPESKEPLPSTVTFGSYNIQNLFLRVVGKSPSDPGYKEKQQRIGNANVISELNPDFQILAEVENLQALREFNQTFLEGRYEPLLIDGNDVRGIDVAILVKRSLNVEVEWRSFKSYPSAAGIPIFSRDLPTAFVYSKDASGKRSAKPQFALMATHFKSKRVDPEHPVDTAQVRASQTRATLEIVDKIRTEFGSDLPVLLAGDFNNTIHDSSEFTALFSYGFKDTLDLTPNGTSAQDRATHYYFPGKGPPEAHQLDAILLLSDHSVVEEAKVIPNRDNQGNTLGAPKTYKERERLPSDHRAVSAKVHL